MKIRLQVLVRLFLSSTLFLLGCSESKKPLFTQLPPDVSGVTFENKVVESPEINILSYEYTYNGGGVAAGDFNNDGLCDLYFTGNMVPNRLYLSQGNLKFKDITESAGVGGRSMWKTGVAVADVNGDGWLDIYVCYSGPDAQKSLSNELYINNGGEKGGLPTFTEQAQQYGLDAPGTFSTQASFFDYDRDGDLDMFLINHGNHFYSPFINTNQLRNTRHPQFGNRLYRHDTSTPDGPTSHSFVEVSQEAGIHGGGINFSLGVSISDVNGDLWPDIFVTNDYEEQDFLYLNNGKGGFIETTKKSFDHLSRNGMGTDIADYDNDGKTDLIEMDMWPEDNFRQKLLRGPDDYNRYNLMLDSGFHHQQMRNTLQMNTGNDSQGTPIFSEIGQMAGISSTDWSWAPLFVDVDNDGLKDLFVTNGYLRDFTSMDFLKYTVEDAKKEAMAKGQSLQVYELVSKMSSTKTSDYLFRNNGDLTFSDFSKEWGIYQPNLSFGVTYADLDNDGDVEMITNNTNETATIWQNNASEKKLNTWLSVKLVGPPGNSFGVGSSITVETDLARQIQELYPTRGFQSSVEPIIHFGLGAGQNVKKLRVVWPDGRQSELMDVKVNGMVEVTYATATESTTDAAAVTTTLFRDVTSESKVDFVHHENEFVDFDREPLIPYQLSRTGPALAKGDVNNDGLEDLYVGGAAGQKSVLYLSVAGGSFVRAGSQPWETEAVQEDTGATFFDVDGDHDLDLFVVSGGNEFDNGSVMLDDRLYLNLGAGKFRRAPDGATPADHASGSCVVAGDYDKDGDIDLFVGGHGMPGKFPLTGPGAILRNDTDVQKGLIKLALATQDVNPDLREAGMVTDAIWTDFNNDGWPDLIVVGEWAPVRLFENKTGKLVAVQNKTLDGSSGLWNRIAAADLDQDGDIDYVIGNAGTNLPWHASAAEPITLYYDDFNSDGRIDPIICSFVQGKSYPVASRDEMLLQMNSLRKKYNDYSSYAAATIEDIVGPDRVAAAKKMQITTLQSSVLENLGNGQFKLTSLPLMAQFSSVRGILIDDFNGDSKVDVLLSGNFFPFRTQYGPSDASKGLLLEGRGQGAFDPRGWESTGFYVPGDVRNMLLLNENRIVLARNNGSVLVFEIKRNTKQ